MLIIMKDRDFAKRRNRGQKVIELNPFIKTCTLLRLSNFYTRTCTCKVIVYEVSIQDSRKLIRTSVKPIDREIDFFLSRLYRNRKN